MATRRDSKPATQDQTPPPYYIAVEPLYIDDQFSRAHNPGDRVPADHVDRFGWRDKVRRPDQPASDDHNEPETTHSGQATSEGTDA
ncbi:hypothetical protein [Nonomuraea indica]|uniref:hypothetical protein n=1 Tax=Nonomuraea indica TaxID=1581193 RepID=UPI000C79939F|nr:hypothetical protein [Nonomuraea indica]